MRVHRYRVIATLLAGALVAAQARADDAPHFVYGYAQLMTQYVARGLSQSVGEPSAQVELDLNPGDGVYGCISAVREHWVDAVYAGARVPLEFDGEVGYRKRLASDAVFDAGVLRLQFPGDYPRGSGALPNTTEVYARIHWRAFTARINTAATDAFGTANSRGSSYIDLAAARPLGDAWLLGAHLGRKIAVGSDPNTHERYSDHFTYTDYRLTAARGFGSGLSLTLGYTWTTADQATYTLRGNHVGGHKLAATLEWDF